MADNNDRIILDQVLEQQHASRAPGLSDADFFELFTAEQVLKDIDLSYDEIEAGLVGAGSDGGIDAFYTFVNGELILEDTQLPKSAKNLAIEVVIIQSKRTASFSESAFDKLRASCDDLFDLSKPLDNLGAMYNAQLLAAAKNFRSAFKELAGKFPKLGFRFAYATRGDQVHPNVSRKGEHLCDAVKKHFSGAEADLRFLGARGLLDLARQVPDSTLTLPLAEVPISSTGRSAFIALVRLVDFAAFITEQNGHLRSHLFESNVRDYQGATQVNEQIQATLREDGDDDFWWLNNGVTILAGKAVYSGKSLTISEPQIVNGLQTSREIYKYFRECNTTDENRTLLVRVLEPEGEESHDRIVRATNSQTPIPPASLRATDRIHRNIEAHLQPHGLFYDRRKNFYKNEGKPRDQIIGIPQLAQSVMSALIQRPDTARSRPSSLLKKDEDYQRLFNEDLPIGIYLVCAKLAKTAELYLRDQGLETRERNNLRFHLITTVAALGTGVKTPGADALANLDVDSLPLAQWQQAFALVREEFTSLGRTDAVAKGADFAKKVRERIAEVLGGARADG